MKNIALSCIFLLPLGGWAQRPPTSVFVTPVKQTLFVDEIEALGTLQSNENVDLTSTVTERVTQINFDDGQRVKQGDILVEMDAAQEIAEKIEERSRIDEAQRLVERLRPLVERGAASQSELDQRTRELQTAEARLKAIQSRIDERRIIAPFDGVVGLRNLSVGALATPGTLITTLDDDRVMKLDFSVPEIYLATLRPGIQIQAQASAYPGQLFKATVHSVDSRVDPTTRSIQARALLNNEDRSLHAGMLMQTVLRKQPRQALTVPEEAILIRGDQPFVMVAVEAKGKTTVERRPIEIGARRQGEAEILSGVKAGERVIHHGVLKVQPGAEVTIQGVARGDESLNELLQSSKSKPGDKS